MIGSRPVKAGRMPSCSGRYGPDLFRLGVHDDVAVSDGSMADTEFQDSVEQQSPAARAAPVEPEDELGQIVAQVRRSHGALMGSQQPALGQ